tara:strand:+ start:111 stop:992 length:882 start_codon:yes stop_codon:yes gene_type:complete
MNINAESIIPFLGFHEPFSSLTHLLAAFALILATIQLLRKGQGNYMRVAGLLTYSLSALFLFTMSGLYHMLKPGILKEIFLRFDYMGIWFLIAGTFTPIHIILFRKKWRWLMLVIIWSLAFVGATFTSLFSSEMPEYIIRIFFLILGWTGVLSCYRIWKLYGFKMLMPIVYGGLIYTFGAIVELFNGPIILSGIIEGHELFHCFVNIGAAFHWYFIYKIAHEPTKESLLFQVFENSDGELLAKGKFEPIRIKSRNLDTLKKLITEEINYRFHPKLKPRHIRLRFLKEDLLKIN